MQQKEAVMKGTRLCATLALAAGLILPATAEPAAPPSPSAVLEQAARELITALAAERGRLAAEPRRVQALVDRHITPHVDLVTASRWVLGPHWRSASREQKKAFIREFHTLLVRFYSAALADYLKGNEVRPEMLRFQPVRTDGGGPVVVRSQVIPPDGEPIPVHYHVHFRRGRWRIYDVSVDGVSMITTYRTSFDTQVRREGLDGLIRALAERNRRLAAEPAAAR